MESGNCRLLTYSKYASSNTTMVSASEVERLLLRVPAHTVVGFDEAYFEYGRSQQFPDSMAYVKQGRNVIVLRTRFRKLVISAVVTP